MARTTIFRVQRCAVETIPGSTADAIKKINDYVRVVARVARDRAQAWQIELVHQHVYLSRGCDVHLRARGGVIVAISRSAPGVTATTDSAGQL